MKIKIVHLVYSFGVGGLERVLANLINFSDSEKVEHIIVTQIDDNSFSTQLDKPVRFYCLDKRDGLDLASHTRIFKLLKEIGPDVFHTYNFGTMEYHFAAYLAGVKTRVHADHGKQSSYQKMSNPLKYELFRRAVALFVDSYVVVSEDLYLWATRRLKLSPPKLKLVFNGIDQKEFAYTEAATRRRTNFALTFICVGRLVDVKNHAFLIRSFAKAIERCPSLAQSTLNIVGDGPEFSRLQDLIAQLGVEGSVNLLGARADIPELLRSADVFVLSSKYEAQPMTILEAMACSLPVIATAVGGISTVVADDVNGILVESGNEQEMSDALITAANSPEKMAELGAEGVKTVAKTFSVEAMCASYNHIYKV